MQRLEPPPEPLLRAVPVSLVELYAAAAELCVFVELCVELCGSVLVAEAVERSVAAELRLVVVPTVGVAVAPTLCVG